MKYETSNYRYARSRAKLDSMSFVPRLYAVLVAGGAAVVACGHESQSESQSPEPSSGPVDAAESTGAAGATITDAAPTAGTDASTSDGGGPLGTATTEGGQAESGSTYAGSDSSGDAAPATTGEACCPEECWSVPCECTDGACCWLVPHERCCEPA